MFNLAGRENSIFEILAKFKEAKMSFILVGGYAVSAYRHRFSVDADIVVKKEDLKEFEKILKENNFSKTIFKELDIPYAEFVRYESAQNISVDLLIGGVAVRQTDAFFSYELLLDNSQEMEVIGTEKADVFRIPGKEILMAMKIHSGRLTDFRDIAALAQEIDLSLLKKFVSAGNIDVVKTNLRKLSEILESQNFIDSFKGVFAEKKFINVEEAKKICSIIS